MNPRFHRSARVAERSGGATVTRFAPLRADGISVRWRIMKCLNCGGPLEYAGAQKEFARCTHCVSLFHHDARRNLSPMQIPTPPGVNPHTFAQDYAVQLGFAPRKASHEVVGANIGGVNVGVKLNTGKMERDIKNKVSGYIWGLVIGGIIIFLIIATFAGIGIYAYFQAKDMGVTGGGGGGGAAGPSAPGKPATWDGKATFNCTGNDNVSLTGVSATLASGDGIHADGNCKLSITGANITAGTAINASGNARISVTGGNLKGTANAISASGNAQVTCVGTTVTGKTSSSDNGKITGVGVQK
jgi:hypothetical protein